MRGSRRPRANHHLGVGVFVAALLGLLFVAVPALAQDASLWERNRGNCDSVLSEPQLFELQQVRECAQRWESYGHPDAISRQEAQAYARGFSRLHHQGNERDRSLAESALSRLGLSVLPGGDFLPNERLETFLSRNRSPISVSEASNRDRQRAQSSNTDGMREYNRGNYESAAGEFRDALDHDPFYILAKYNLVCQLALLGNSDEALRHLDELSRWDSGDAREQMTHTLTDGDLVSLRDDVRFRLITGYARVQVLNGAGTGGVARTTEIRDALAAEGYDVASFGYDRYTRARAVVYYGRGYEDVGGRVATMVGDGTQSRRIDWPSDYDLVVVWGASGEASASLAAPVVQGFLSVEGGDPEEAVEDTEEALEEIPDVIEDPEGAAEEWEPPF